MSDLDQLAGHPAVIDARSKIMGNDRAFDLMTTQQWSDELDRIIAAAVAKVNEENRRCETCKFYGPGKLFGLHPICFNEIVRSSASSHVTPRSDFCCNQYDRAALPQPREVRE